MLKKLRIKFVAVIMVIVTIMIGIIFTTLYYSTSLNLERESMQMMASVALNPQFSRLPRGQFENVNLPYFSIMFNHTGEAIEVSGGFFDLSDEEFLDKLMVQTQETHAQSGVLDEYNLRFLRTDTPFGQSIVFADVTSEETTLNNLIKTFALIGSAAFLIFFGISILLSRWAVKPVEQAWQQQKQFIADASHELKTPLTVILTDAELLSTPECSDSDRTTLSSNITTMSHQMRGLVENMLELARMDSGTLKGTLSTVSFSDAMNEEAMLFEPLLFDKNYMFTYDIAPDIQILGNAAHLKQLPYILLDNAAKYATPGASIRMTLRRTSQKRCILEVANEGEPISSQELKDLFKRFYRADKVRTLSHSYGLGLSIAESIVQEHHGKIWAQSDGGYNRFLIELPTSN